MKLVDLSQTIRSGMPLFAPDAPQPHIEAWLSHEQSAAGGRYQGTSCEITQISMVTSIGTYLDSPFHFIPNADTIGDLALEQLVLPGVVIDCRSQQPQSEIAAAVLDGHDLAGKAVLLRTDWSLSWGSPHYYEHPYIGLALAERLRDAGARLVGVDFLMADNKHDPTRPAHVTLLNANILIVENLRALSALPRSGFVFHAVPPKIAQAAAFPVRAYAVVE